MSIVKREDRLKWRQHLVHTAISNELITEEMGGADRTESERESAYYALADLIASATFLDEESTSDLVTEIANHIVAAVQEHDENVRKNERQQWVDAVAAGKTDWGYEVWRHERGWGA